MRPGVGTKRSRRAASGSAASRAAASGTGDPPGVRGQGLRVRSGARARLEHDLVVLGGGMGLAAEVEGDDGLAPLVDEAIRWRVAEAQPPPERAPQRDEVAVEPKQRAAVGV